MTDVMDTDSIPHDTQDKPTRTRKHKGSKKGDPFLTNANVVPLGDKENRVDTNSSQTPKNQNPTSIHTPNPTKEQRRQGIPNTFKSKAERRQEREDAMEEDETDDFEDLAVPVLEHTPDHEDDLPLPPTPIG